MRLGLFTVSDVCKSRHACVNCRDRSPQGEQWRRSLGVAWDLPDGNVNFDCPYGVPWSAPSAPVPHNMGLYGPPLWQELHSRPPTFTDPVAEQNWLTAFACRIPCQECRVEWANLTQVSPADLTSPLGYAIWTWRAHNTINLHIHKAPFEWHDAVRKYGWEKLVPTVGLELPSPTLPMLSKSVMPAEIQAAKVRAERRAVLNKPRCEACPAEHFRGFPNSQEVNCAIGARCCNGKITEGLVHLGWGQCNGKYWVPQQFDRVVVLNLERRADRLERFWGKLPKDWPFAEVQVVKAIDGDRVGVPGGWRAGAGTWGCMASHRRILEDALMDGVESVLVMEDDAFFVDDFTSKVIWFLNEVPENWDCLMLGGQHMYQSGEPLKVKPGVLRCVDAQRTHAYAVRGPFLKALYSMWQSYSGHCDHALGPFAAKYNTYAPDPWLVGQEAGPSDISGRDQPRKTWTPPGPDEPIVWLRCPKEAFEEVKTTFHSGYTPTTGGFDVGLERVFEDLGLSEKQRVLALKDWLTMIMWEASSISGALCTVWHPRVDEHILYEAARLCNRALIRIDAHTADEAFEQAEVLLNRVRTTP